MTVVNVVLGSSAEVSPITRLSLARPDSVSAESPLNSALARLVRGAILCNDASFEPAAVVGAPPNVVGGNGTDKALLSWSLSLGGATELPGWLCRLRVPFSSVTKQVGVTLSCSRVALPCMHYAVRGSLLCGVPGARRPLRQYARRLDRLRQGRPRLPPPPLHLVC